MKRKKKITGASWYLVGILIAALIFIGVALMYSGLRVQELGAEVQSLQADKHPNQVIGIHNNVDHKRKMKR